MLEPHDWSTDRSNLTTNLLQALDTLALHLGPKMVLGPSLAFARQGISSSSRDVRWAACTVALVVTEGCADGLRKRLPEILQVTKRCIAYWQPGWQGNACPLHAGCCCSLGFVTQALNKEGSLG